MAWTIWNAPSDRDYQEQFNPYPEEEEPHGDKEVWTPFRAIRPSDRINMMRPCCTIDEHGRCRRPRQLVSFLGYDGSPVCTVTCAKHALPDKELRAQYAREQTC